MKGIIYYNRGTKCLIRLAVSMYSLRQVYSGNITVLIEDAFPAWLDKLSKELKVGTKLIPASPHPLLRKTELWKYTPYEENLYLDSDTLILKDPSPLFEPEITKEGYAVTEYANWVSKGTRIAGRIRAWKNIINDEEMEKALNFGPAVNTGVFYFHTKRGEKFLTKLETITQKAFSHPDYNSGKIHDKVLDEIGSQIAVSQEAHVIVGEMWNRSANHGVSEDPGIIHFHGGKHVLPDNKWCDLWKAIYWKLRHRFKEMASPNGDRRLRDYMDNGSRKYHTKAATHKDLTVVSCADVNYAPRLTRNFKLWMELPGLREQNFIIFTLNSGVRAKEYDELRKYSNVRLIPFMCEYPIREAAFSSFVYGVAQHVKTPFWMKLDGDASPTAVGKLEWPTNWREFTITADPWHYTRNKPGSEREGTHWLNRLDDWYGGEKMFKENIPGNERFGHPRMRSYCWIEKTSFTKAIVAKCGPRLPVPSHDTTSWYLAVRMKEPIQSYKFRRWINA